MSRSDPSDESEEFSLLDSYLLDLQTGGKPDHSAVVDRYPDLAGALEVLQLLEGLAPDVAGESTTGLPVDPENTVAFTANGGIGAVAPDSSAAERPASGFGKYEIIEEVGRGGMGVVFKARQRDLDRIVALKTILSSHLTSDEQVHRFQAEAKAAGSLKHPNIIGIYDVGKVHEQHYFAMEFVKGESLAELIRNRPMEPMAAAACLSTVARAVSHLHEHGIVHRDLKPSNILIDEHGEPHVTDFGLAKIFSADSQMTRSGEIVGTPSYMAPEQAAGKSAEVTPQSDVYSLGAILYEMLTGRPTFREANPLDTLVRVLEGEPTLPSKLNPTVPRELEIICLRCLEKEPTARYPTAVALADDLDRFLRGEMVQARPFGPWHRIRHWARRQPALASRLAGIGVFYGVDLANYASGVIDASFHRNITIVLGLWVVVSGLCQWMLTRRRHAAQIPYCWAAADGIILTAVLHIADGVKSPILVTYLLLIAAAGLWSRVRLVLFMTFVTFVGYLFLWIESETLRVDLHRQFDHHIIFLAAVAVMGFVVGYQVQRVRALNRYLERRRIL